MPFKFFRPWEDNGEASTSQARTHHHGSAAQASEVEKQPQVYSSGILQPAQSADPSNSLLSLEPLAGSKRLDFDAGKLYSDDDCHGDSKTQKRLHDLDNTCRTTFPFIILRDDPSLACAGQMICTQKVSPVVESFMTFDSLRNSSSSTCPSSSAAESNFPVNVTPIRTQTPGQNLAIAKCSNGLDESTGLDRTLQGQNGHLPIKPDHDVATSSNVDGQKCPAQFKSFKCTSCNKTFSRSSHLHMHKQTHTGSKPFKCKFCAKHFTRSSNLHQHEQTHTGSKPFKCTVCMKAFTQSSSLQVHRRIHTGSKPFQCRFCGKEFAQSGNVQVHERTHTGSKPFKCQFCEKGFARSSHLHSHEQTHTGSKPFQCMVCTKSFTQSSNLRVHQRIHTGYRPFQCRICGKDFVQSSGLHLHERIHTGSKPFKCRFCGKSFAQSSSLYRHEKTHEGCKPFKCTFCMKTFTQYRSLQVHERTHTGFGPFQCRICGKDFAQSCDVLVHEQTHT